MKKEGMDKMGWGERGQAKGRYKKKGGGTGMDEVKDNNREERRREENRREEKRRKEKRRDEKSRAEQRREAKRREEKRREERRREEKRSEEQRREREGEAERKGAKRGENNSWDWKSEDCTVLVAGYTCRLVAHGGARALKLRCDVWPSPSRDVTCKRCRKGLERQCMCRILDHTSTC